MQEARDEKERRHREWVSRQQSHIARWEDQRDRAHAFADRLRGQIDDLRCKIRTAHNADWAGRAEGWLDDKLRKLSDVENQISDLERKIADVRSRLR